MKCPEFICTRNQYQLPNETILSSFRWFSFICFWFRSLAHSVISGIGTAAAVLTAAHSFVADEVWCAWAASHVRNFLLIF
jgi:hypothetical protein